MGYMRNYLLIGGVRIPLGAQCVECGREFNLTNEDEADEYVNGHDCEGG